MPIPVSDVSVIGEHEKKLLVAFSLIRLLLEKLAQQLGPQALGPELAGLTKLGDRSDAEATVKRIDDLLREGQEPAATRQYREAMGTTWDCALDVINRWSSYALETKIQHVQMRDWETNIALLLKQAEAMLVNRVPSSVMRVN